MMPFALPGRRRRREMPRRHAGWATPYAGRCQLQQRRQMSRRNTGFLLLAVAHGAGLSLSSLSRLILGRCWH